MKPIYLDANAGSMARPQLERAARMLAEAGNPSSVHRAGQRGKSLLREARRNICRLMGASGVEKDLHLSFTSGGTEAANQMLFGFLGPVFALAKYPGRIVSSAIEHPCVLEPLERLRASGWDIVLVHPDKSGTVSVDEIVSKVNPETSLVTLMMANNETGVIQPVRDLAIRLRAANYRGPIVSDAVQAFGKLPLDVLGLFHAGLDALALSGHKSGAAAGVGALVLNTRSDAVCRSFSPILSGGQQENGYRPGTENLLGILTWSEAAKDLFPERDLKCRKIEALRNRLWEMLAAIEGTERIGADASLGVLGNTLMIRIAGCRADDLVVALDVAGVMVSTGSACSSGRQSPSHVVRAMGYSETEAREALRFSLDWDTTEEEILRAGQVVREVVTRARRSKDESSFDKSLEEMRSV